MLQMLPLPRILLPGYGAARRAAAQIRNLLGRFVRPRFEAARRCEADPRNDILAALLRARDPETGYVFGFEDLLDQICVLFLAGHETSASALAWALYLIANCPHLQERLHAEAVAVMGGGPARFAHIRQLKFARDVFRETLRLYPPVSFMLRDAGEATTMRDKAICPADPLFVSPWLIHRHRGQWERPDVFDPDRFASDSAKASLKTSYLPFSLGPRVCLGANFAMQEAILTLASMALTFRFDPVAGHVPRPVSRLTVRSANGIRLAVTLRPVSPGVAGAGENFPAAAP
jgi:cytochrome P450